AAKGLDNEETNKKGRIIRQERYAGAMQRSFYVGDALEEEDVKASFKHGVLNLTFPKKEKAKVPEKKTIMIEG
ncbi:MAG: Hsp20 family protein, partial [Lachnospiraceae bacterium]|nr:Hsp20 family protein [Lachnospiraceae bacterium]